jgi:hypothetical protein
MNESITIPTATSIDEKDIKTFKIELKKHGLNLEKEEWPLVQTLVNIHALCFYLHKLTGFYFKTCDACRSKNKECIITGVMINCDGCNSSRLPCSRGPVFKRWRTCKKLGITEARFDLLKAALGVQESRTRSKRRERVHRRTKTIAKRPLKRPTNKKCDFVVGQSKVAVDEACSGADESIADESVVEPVRDSSVLAFSIASPEPSLR